MHRLGETRRMEKCQKSDLSRSIKQNGNQDGCKHSGIIAAHDSKG